MFACDNWREQNRLYRRRWSTVHLTGEWAARALPFGIWKANLADDAVTLSEAAEYLTPAAMWPCGYKVGWRDPFLYLQDHAFQTHLPAPIPLHAGCLLHEHPGFLFQPQGMGCYHRPLLTWEQISGNLVSKAWPSKKDSPWLCSP